MPRHKSKAHWINPHISAMMRQRDFLAIEAQKPNAHPAVFDDLKLLRKQVKSNIRCLIKTRGSKMLADGDVRNAWKFLREVTFTTTKGGKTSMDLATLNDAFAETVTATTAAPLSTVPCCDSPSSFSISTLNETEVTQMLKKLNVYTATGPDEIPASLLKRIADAASTNITHIMNASLTQASFPQPWKHANVAAVWKSKGSKSEASNYRPISVLPVLGRMLEKAVAKQLTAYGDENHILPIQQFGFRSKSSCEHALLTATNSWMNDIDVGHLVGALLIDFSKAFDTVLHQLLLGELSAIGCNTSAVKWFHSYLWNRK